MAVKIFTLPVITIAAGGVPQKIFPTWFPVTSVTLIADKTNTGDIIFGDENIDTSGTGGPIPPGENATIEADQTRAGSEEFSLDEVWVTSGTAGDKVRVMGFRRKP